MAGFKRAPGKPDPEKLAAFIEGAATTTQQEPSAKPAPKRATAKKRTGRPPKTRPKAIRRTFSMRPEDDQALAELVRRAGQGGAIRGKSDMVRAGIAVLAELSPEKLAEAVGRVEKLK